MAQSDAIREFRERWQHPAELLSEADARLNADFMPPDFTMSEGLKSAVLDDVMRATWTAVHNKEASVVAALFASVGDQAMGVKDVEDVVVSSVTFLCNIWQRLFGYPHQSLRL
jgi:hypothetical protein